MSLASRLTALSQAIGADVKKLNDVAMLKPVRAVYKATADPWTPSANVSDDFEDGAAVAVGDRVLYPYNARTEPGVYIYTGSAVTGPTYIAGETPIPAGRSMAMVAVIPRGATPSSIWYCATSGANGNWARAVEKPSVAKPCMAVYTANVNLAAAVVSNDLFPGDRVLLVGQTTKTQNGVYALSPDTGAGAFFKRVTEELYQAGQLFPVVTKKVLGLDDDYSNPVIYACTDYKGSDNYEFTLISGGATAGPSSSPLDLPIFRAYLSASAANVAQTGKIPFDKITVDSNGWFANGRFTPQRAGWYRITATAEPTGLPANAMYEIQLRKNGTNIAWGSNATMGAATPAAVVTDLVYFNGSTDYVEVNSWTSTGAAHTVTGDANGVTTYFAGEFVGTGQVNPARRLKGYVGTPNTVLGGTGFSVVRNAAGNYTVTFTKAFGATPVLTIVPHYAGAAEVNWRLNAVSANSFQVVFTDGGGAGLDSNFQFIAEDAGLGLEATMDVEAWHTVGAVGEPAFENGYVARATNAVPAFRKTPDGKVHLKGTATIGTAPASRAFTLPVGYRPKESDLRFPVISNGVFGYVYVSTDGSVMVATGTTWVDFSSISFFTD